MRDTSLPIERRADAARIVDGCKALLSAESMTRDDLEALAAE
jgi:hypothetical protein